MDDLKGKTYQVGELLTSEAKDYLAVFIDSGLHLKPIRFWPKGRTECIFEYSPSSSSDKKLYRVRNRGQLHAEELLLDDLKKMVKTSTLSDKDEIKVFINYSPCDKCSEWLKNHLENSKPLKITFVFAQLFDINRESCSQRCKAKGCIERKNPATVENLRAIKDHLKPMDEHEWIVLQRLLLKYSVGDWPDISERKVEDKWLQEDWKKVKGDAESELNEKFMKMNMTAPSTGTPSTD